MAVGVKELRVSDVASDPVGLRRRMDEDGYLFLRRLVSPDQVWSLRVEILSICQEGGWLKPGSKPAEGLADVSKACVEPEAAYMSVYNNVLRLEHFNNLAHQPEILSIMQVLIGEDVLPHPTKIGRIMFPQNNAHSTPAHQDYVQIQGAMETYTCWMPLGDSPLEIGGLAVLPGSHRRGLYEYEFALGAGGMGVEGASLSGEWLSTDYEAGDVLIFHSMTVHKALPNVTEERLRLSVDYRYQPASEPIVETFLKPQYGQISWEEVYAGWKSRDLQYYWRVVAPKSIERDWSYYNKRDAEALERAAGGDEAARAAVLRIIGGHPDPEMRKAAEEVLRSLDAQIGQEV